MQYSNNVDVLQIVGTWNLAAQHLALRIAAYRIEISSYITLTQRQQDAHDQGLIGGAQNV